jgi:hypothetical protein
MGIEIIENDPNDLGLWIPLIHEPLHLLREVLLGSPLGHLYMPPARLRLAEDKQIARALTLVFVIFALRMPVTNG